MVDLPDYYTQAQISEAEAASFKGGLDDNKSDTPVSRDIYFGTDTGILYICIVDGAWTGFDASILTTGQLPLARLVAAVCSETEADEKVAAADIFSKFREFVSWVSVEGFTTTIDTGGSITAEGTTLYLVTGNVTGRRTHFRNRVIWAALLDAAKVITLDNIVNALGVITTQTIWLCFTTAAAFPPSDTSDHFGFKIIDADLFATNADGTTQKITDTAINMSSGSQRTRLKAVLNPGTDCKFYVNDVLKVTHTENLPDAPNYYLSEGIETNDDQVASIRLGRILIEKEHA